MARWASLRCKVALLSTGMLTAIALAVAPTATSSTGSPVGSTEIFDTGTTRLSTAATTQLDTTYYPSTYPASGGVPTVGSWTAAEKRSFSVLEYARMGAKLAPAMRLLGTVSLGATALEVGWKIGTPAGATIYKKITGDDYGTTATLQAPTVGGTFWRVSRLQWKYFTASDVIPSTTTKWPQAGWYLSYSRCNTAACTPSGTIWAIGTPSAAEIEAANSLGSTVTWVDSGTTRIAVYMSEAAFQAAATIVPSDLTTYNATPVSANKIDTGTYTPPTSSPTITDRANAGAAFVANPATTTTTTGTDEQLGAQDELCNDTSGLTCEDGVGVAATPVTTETTFVLPRPYTWETYQDYTDRLRALGWLGTITYTDDTTLDGTADPGSDYEAAPIGGVTAIVVGAGSPTAIYDSDGQRLAWPTSAPQVTADDDIEVKKKPDSTDLPPPAGSTGGGIDFDPITSLDFGCKFPFGFICYAQEVNGIFDTSPEAPRFNLDVHSNNVGTHAYAVGTNYDVNLNVMDDYMDIWRTLVSFVLWIGGVYFLAVRLVGFKAGGDPGEALDDASPI